MTGPTVIPFDMYLDPRPALSSLSGQESFSQSEAQYQWPAHTQTTVQSYAPNTDTDAMGQAVSSQALFSEES